MYLTVRGKCIGGGYRIGEELWTQAGLTTGHQTLLPTPIPFPFTTPFQYMGPLSQPIPFLNKLIHSLYPIPLSNISSIFFI